MNIKKLNEELEKYTFQSLDDKITEESTVSDYIHARTDHIEESLGKLCELLPEIKDTYEYEDIINQIQGLHDLANGWQ